MDRADRIRITWFYIVVGGIFTNAVAGAVLASTYIHLTGTQLLFASFVFVAAFCLYFYNRYTFTAVTAGFFLCAVAVLLYLWHMDFDVEWLGRFIDWVRELAGHVTGMTPYREEYRVLGYLVVALFACFTTLFVRTGISFFLLSALGFCSVGILAYLGYQIPGMSAISVLLVSACLLMLKLSRSASRLGRDEDGEPVYSITTNGLLLLPICLIILLTAGFVPRPETDEGRNVLQNFEGNLYRLNNFFLDRFGPKYFSFSTTGFSQSGGRLGGNIAPNNRHVMDVYVAFGARPYLAGAYSDSYTGDRWLSVQGAKTPLADVPGYRTDPGAPSGWGDISGLPMDSLFEIVRPDLRPGDPDYERLRMEYLVLVMGRSMPTLTVIVGQPTTTVFTPANGITVRHSDGEFAISGQNAPMLPSTAGTLSAGITGSVSTQSVMKRGTYYTIDYMEQADRSIFGNSALLDSLFRQYPTDTSDERLAPYLELPESLPQRVRDLAREITKDAGNPYEKMKALEAFLSQYPYTLTPGPVPADVDFVDWFLFEGKEGYCTYYATALAVMGRCVGVPTRYAEGFTLPTSADSGGLYAVTNAQAHAWCDAFFPFAGWTTFEATAPFTYPFYNNGRLPTLDNLDEWSGGDEEMIDDMLDDMLGDSGLRPITSNPGDGQQGMDDADILATALISAGIAALVALLIWLRYWYYRRRIAKLESAPPREAAVAYFKRIAGVLASNGLALEPHETAFAYARRVDGGRGIGIEHYTLEEMARIFARAAYSAEEITAHERDSMARCYAMMTERAGAPMMERFAAWIERYMLGKY